MRINLVKRRRTVFIKDWAAILISAVIFADIFYLMPIAWGQTPKKSLMIEKELDCVENELKKGGQRYFAKSCKDFLARKKQDKRSLKHSRLAKQKEAGTPERKPFELEARYWFADVEGSGKYSGSAGGSNLDIKSDLGIEESGLLDLRAYWHENESTFYRFDMTRLNFDGGQAINGIIGFGDQTFNSTTVAADKDIVYYRLGWFKYLVSHFNNRVRAGSAFILKVFNGEATVSDSTKSETVDLFGVMPSVGVILNATLNDKANLYLEASGMSAGKFGHIFEYEGGLKIDVYEDLYLSGGYRRIDFDVEYDDNELDMEIYGPYVGGSLKF